jgi:monovalent cation:H+ antiporter, CPA1 family
MLESISIIICFVAFFSYMNARYFKMPQAIFLMITGILFSGLLLVADHIVPSLGHQILDTIQKINFSESLLGFMLSFMLFAGALHVSFSDLRASGLSIASFALIGTVISSFVIGGLLWFAAPLFGTSLPFIHALLFGCLISPTDPIAVLGILRNAGIKKSVEIKIIGESLFNDGVSVVLFITILAILNHTQGAESPGSSIRFFLQEVLGGIGGGLVIGYIGFHMMKAIDHFQSEILISLAMVMGGYYACTALHFSGPLAMVVAGLITGNTGRENAMSQMTRDYLGKFWEVLDEVFNAFLFVMIGIQALQIKLAVSTTFLAVVAYFMLVGSRYISLIVPAILLRFRHRLEANEIAAMTWGGLRGGISVALALTIPANPYRDLVVTVTFVVVALSIILQGFSIGYFVRRWKLSTN